MGSEDLAKKILDGWTGFDVVIAAPDMMKHVGKLGKVLGPQGKMPSPKSGTVTPDVGQAVREFKAGKVEFRTDPGGSVHAPVGKRSFSVEDLEANISLPRRAHSPHAPALREGRVHPEGRRLLDDGPGAHVGSAVAGAALSCFRSARRPFDRAAASRKNPNYLDYQE